MRIAGDEPGPAIDDIVRDPEWLCQRYDPASDTFRFRRVARARRSAVPFLTDQLLGEDPGVVLPRRAVPQPQGPVAGPHFIFHSAFCASTMLCHALDVAGSASSLSEPVVINDLVGWRQRGAAAREHGVVTAQTLQLLARPFSPDEAVVVKPSNVVNPLAAGLMTLSPASRAILLHAPLHTFLTSVAHKGLWCRLWVRELLERLLADRAIDLGFEPREYLRQTDLQIAAVGWLAQHALFHAMTTRFGGTRIATLDSELLATDPVPTIAAVRRHLGLAQGDVSPTAITRDSKTGGAFVPGQRERDHAVTYAAHRDEIDKVHDWALAVANGRGIALELPLPLAP